MTQVTLGKWGDNLAVRLPSDIVRLAGLRDGEQVDIAAQAGEIVIRRAESVLNLDDMFSGKTEAEWRGMYADAYDWRPDIGREAVEP